MAQVSAHVRSAGQAVPMLPKTVPVVLAGIILEYNTVEDVVKQTEMTVGEIESVMAVNSAWPFPGHEDGGWGLRARCLMNPFWKSPARSGHMLSMHPCNMPPTVCRHEGCPQRHTLRHG